MPLGPIGGSKPTTPPRAGFKWTYRYDAQNDTYAWVEEADPDYVAPPTGDPNLSRNPDGTLAGSLDDIIAKTVAKREAQKKTDEEYARLTGAVYDYTMKGDYVNGVYQGTPNDNQKNAPTPGSSAYILKAGTPAAAPSQFTPTYKPPAPIKMEEPYAGNVALPTKDPRTLWSWKRR